MNKKINKPCNFFQKGNCNKGDNCQFLHGDSDMNAGNQMGGPNKVNKQCGFYASGKCRKGENCEYIHGNSELIMPNNQNQNKQEFQNKGLNKNLCRKFQGGTCENQNCK